MADEMLPNLMVLWVWHILSVTYLAINNYYLRLNKTPALILEYGSLFLGGLFDSRNRTHYIYDESQLHLTKDGFSVSLVANLLGHELSFATTSELHTS